MTDTTDIFRRLVRDAIRIDHLVHAGPPITSGPTAIAAAIYSTHDRLPGGSGVSETGVRAARMEECVDPTCDLGVPGDGHTHATPVDPTGDAAMRPSKSDADLRQLEVSVTTFITAISELGAMSRSKGAPTDWDEALIDANWLDEQGAIDVLERSDQKPRRWVLKAGDALHDIEALWRKQQTREPDEVDRAWTDELADEQCCSVHLQIQPAGVYREKRFRRDLCRTCYQLAMAGDVDRPPIELVEVWVQSPGQVAWRAARSRWLQSRNVRDVG